VEYRNDLAYAAERRGAEDENTELRPLEDIIAYLREYTRERPEVVAVTCFAVGFILGWKLKPW
jgi:hypothetical protein